MRHHFEHIGQKKQPNTPPKLGGKLKLGGSMEKTTTFTTEKEALAIPAPEKRTHVEHWHKTETHFGIRVMRAQERTGRVTRSWVVGWYEGVHHRRKLLGRVGELKWTEAKKKALEHLAKAKRRGHRDIPTFEQAYENYCTQRSHSWAADTVANYQKSIGYLLPFLGTKKVDAITRQDCTYVFGAIKEIVERGSGRKKVKRNGLATATSAMRLARAIFTDLVEEEVIESNPCAGLHKKGIFEKSPVRARMITAKDLPKFWRWLHTEPLPAVRDYILMGLFMGLRKSVVSSLRWDNLVDRGGHPYYILRPDQRGNKRREEIPIPIPTYLVETIIKPRKSSPNKHPIWIIESPRWADQPMRSVRGTFERLAAETGIHLSDHDLRRTIATMTSQLCGDILARRILTHSVDAQDARHFGTSGYVITEKDVLLEGMDKVINYVLDLVAKSENVNENTNHHSLSENTSNQDSDKAP